VDQFLLVLLNFPALSHILEYPVHEFNLGVAPIEQLQSLFGLGLDAVVLLVF
jgi:hypothetical protein